GFEIINMQWKDGKIVKAVIKSNLGGNLRLRVPNEIKMSNGVALKEAKGDNPNTFYQTEKTTAPIISDKATITLPQLKTTWLYDIDTKPGKIYTVVIK
ncbi:MAG TPA: glycoside hydrolase family 95 protein, partial [Parafilimonas sp.]|nr:glycoside hydrolase family 95 protein [Parafilimonas sp.]